VVPATPWRSFQLVAAEGDADQGRHANVPNCAVEHGQLVQLASRSPFGPRRKKERYCEKSPWISRVKYGARTL